MLIRVLLAVAIGLALAACATITEGTTQVVAVDTPGVPGATCTLSTKSGPQIVATPGTVSLKKGPDPIPISCVKPCYVHELSIIRSSSESMPSGDLVSLAIDFPFRRDVPLSRYVHGLDDAGFFVTRCRVYRSGGTAAAGAAAKTHVVCSTEKKRQIGKGERARSHSAT